MRESENCLKSFPAGGRKKSIGDRSGTGRSECAAKRHDCRGRRTCHAAGGRGKYG